MKRLAITRDRVVWHPQVHRFCGEMLYYYFLKIRQFERDMKWLLRVIGDLDIAGYALYEVFGHYDFVLRVWSRTDNHDQLTANLKSLPEIVQYDTFMCLGTPLYSWWPGMPENLDEAEVLANYAELIKAQNGDEDAIKSLHGIGYLCQQEFSATNSPRIAFNTLLETYGPGSIADVQLLRNTAKVVANNAVRRHDVYDISLYYGVNGEFLFEGSTKNYASIGNFVLSLITQAGALPVRTQTLLAIGEPKYESDHIDFRSTFKDPELIKMCYLLKIEERNVQNLSEEKQELLARAFRQIKGIVSFDTRNILSSMFNAYVLDDSELILEKFHYLGEMESLLRDRAIPYIASTIYGKHWTETDFQRLRALAEIPTETYGGDRWSFSDSASLLGAIWRDVENRAEAKQAFSTVFSEGWDTIGSISHEATKIRNEIFHRKMKGPVMEIWIEQYIPFLAKSLETYYRLRLFDKDSARKKAREAVV